MRALVRWLCAEPVRGTVLNVLMLVLLLALVGSPVIFAATGAATVILFALYGLVNAGKAALSRRGRGSRLLEQLLTWLPGAVALCLAILGLDLVVTSGEGSPLQRLGLLLFAFELVALAVVTADLSGLARGRAYGGAL
ncbi:hypothetical protein SAMN02745126_04046 [Enhydrobacter aerosaccus]|uniref:Uncharacterized protein n=1 Tax=Enhydrobacter aerosaccus TaxID=225324 RepID=A0A1T4RR00_9HYPH|nr:hypothetical protein [Enhydrobacter aerosaccus]SKA18455.1 hypothetical protein SAMN02745126_04046 [Enhydrobacter aerosaccus]